MQDAQGGRLPGVSVRIRQTETGVARDVVTDSEGRFNAAALSAGEYELRASLDGFRPLVQTGLRLTVGESAAVTLTLQVGTAEEITVRGTSGVNTQTGELSYLTDQRTIEQIPVNGRNYTDLMQLLPTVNAFPHRDNGSVVAHGLAMSVNGQNPRTNVYLLDGTLQNDFTNSPASSAAGTALGMETIREFRLASNSYSAEYGRAAGGQINVITKSGTNQLAGTGFLFHRNDALDARNYFDVDEKPDFRRYQTGGTLGGPLRTDHLFFFGGYEGLFENLGRTIVTTVPDDNARRGVLPTGTVPISPNDPALPARVPRRERAVPRRRAGAASLRVRSAAAAELRAGPRRRRAVARLAVLRPLHARRRRTGSADRLPAVPARLRLDQPVPHRRVPHRAVAGDLRHGAVRLQPHAHRARPSSRTRRRRCCRSCRAGRRWAPSTSAACRASARSSRPISCSGRTSSAASST